MPNVKTLSTLKVRWADYLIVSECHLLDGHEMTVKDLKTEDIFRKCERSWKYFKFEDGADITPRDAAAVKLWEA